MNDLGDLYQQVILDHNRNPRNFKRLESANRKAEGNNPLCGDRIQLYVQLDGGTITDIGFQMPQGSGCAISKASASLMTDAVKGKPVKDAEAMFAAFGDPGKTLDAAQKALDDANPHVAGFDLPVNAELHTEIVRETRTGHNVVGYLPATMPPPVQ